MKKILTFGILFLAINLYSQNSKNYEVGDDFPEFELETIDGKLLNLESLEGKVVFINLWFTACVPCIEEMPTLNNLQNAYKDKVEFIAITFNDAEEVKKFLLKRDFNFTHLIGAKDLLNDKLKNKAYPRNLILDRNGRITYFGGSLPFTKDSETGEMVPVPYTYFDNPLKKALAN
jgi:thiol-disulfide isomerase/thioredoxin